MKRKEKEEVTQIDTNEYQLRYQWTRYSDIFEKNKTGFF